jgi:hypothetical protein
MALKGKQKKIDANKDGKISGEDFKMLGDNDFKGANMAMGDTEDFSEGGIVARQVSGFGAARSKS